MSIKHKIILLDKDKTYWGFPKCNNLLFGLLKIFVYFIMLFLNEVKFKVVDRKFPTSASLEFGTVDAARGEQLR